MRDGAERNLTALQSLVRDEIGLESHAESSESSETALGFPLFLMTLLTLRETSSLVESGTMLGNLVSHGAAERTGNNTRSSVFSAALREPSRCRSHTCISGCGTRFFVNDPLQTGSVE